MKKQLGYLILFLVGITNLYAEDLKLWYTSPAREWSEALPIGNGSSGAMIYGNPETEEIQLNEETFWAGSPYRNDNPQASTILSQVRELIFTGKNRQAQELINEKFRHSANGMPYLTAGSLKLHFRGHENYTGYYRDLHISDAIATVRYESDGIYYTREIFESFPDQVIIVRLQASEKGKLNFTATYDAPLPYIVKSSGNRLIMKIHGTDHETIPGKIQLENHTIIQTPDGTIKAKSNRIEVQGATEAILYISMATNFINYKNISGDERGNRFFP